MSGQLDLFAETAPEPASPAATSIPPPDQQARTLVVEGLAHTLFVEAGAGSGKTTALVGRVTNLVLSGVPITSIAAITFTEKAAAELRHRVRQQLTRAATSGEESAARAQAARDALVDLDRAPIGTLHAFARRILGEFPVEAELPPRFTVLDEVQSATAFHERFTDFLEGLLDDIAAARLVELCQYDKFGVERGVRRMADDFQANWDLVEERVGGTVPPTTDAIAWRGRLQALCAVIGTFTAPPDDSQAAVPDEFAQQAERIAAAPLGQLLRAAAAWGELKAGRRGNATAWKKHHGSDAVLLQFRDAITALATAAAQFLSECNEERRLTLGALLRVFTLQSVDERRRAGELEFHDLLVFSRRLLASDATVRRELHRRYTHLLLDEFQDTDPIQLELAVRITADPDDQPSGWEQLQPRPGRLTVVGDPKQSIYRFRRADIGQFLRARHQLGATTAHLVANFRSASPVIDWVNHTMGTLIQGNVDVQPEYLPLVAARIGHHDHGSVTVLGATPHDDLGRAGADALREREAADVAAAVVTALADEWQVWADGTLRPCRAGDIAILLPSRLSLAPLQVALAAHGIPHRAENSSLVYAAPEIRALLLALRAADDPTDALALVSALRSPLFGCSDVHLAEWAAVHGRRWGWHDLPDSDHPLADHPVTEGLRCLAALADRLPYQTPSQLLSWLVAERAVLEQAVLQSATRDAWRRIRFVIDQARAWSEAGGHGVRRYLLWTRLQGDDGRFVAETVLPETDHDAVRIMTIHAAKGLEFPITMVSGLTTRGSVRGARRVVFPPNGGWGLAERDDPVYQQFQPVDEQMDDAERRRLLYVACTRACDHLVVSLHRTTTDANTAAAKLAEACTGAGHRELVPTERELVGSSARQHELPWNDEVEWVARRSADMATASTPAALSATSIASLVAAEHPDAAEQKDPVDLDLPPWQRGRYGTAIGRAVHAVLQFADLGAADHDLASLAAAQAAAEGVLGRERTIERLALSALRAPIVRAAAGAPHWKELFVAVDLDGPVVEGYIDLLVRHPERGLTVVDYKTDQVRQGPDRDQRLRRYGVQLAAYGLALERLLGEPVAGGVLVMCRPDGPADEVPVAEWTTTMADLRGRLRGHILRRERT